MAESDGCTDGHSNGSSPHLLMIPMASHAHIATSFRLAKELAKRGVIITFVTVKAHADTLKSTYSAHELQSLGINIESIGGFVPPGDPLETSPRVKLAFEPYAEKLVADKKAGVLGPTCMLVDRFIHWTQDIAEQLDIPRYCFSSNSAGFSRMMQLHTEFETEVREAVDLQSGTVNLPTLVAFMASKPGLQFLKSPIDFPTFTPVHMEFGIKTGEQYATADAVVINTFEELESEAINSMRTAFSHNPNVKAPPVFPVGPLSLVDNFKNERFVAGLDDSHTECVQWLDTQPSKSVLYVCLGSVVRLVGPQITHLALALETSQQRFLWVLSKGRGNFQTLEEALPQGFEARVAGRGKVVAGWVGQVELLAHGSVFGFMSHCGWQSIMESATCGVPILAWPHIAEQHFNSRYVTDVLKIGVRVSEQEHDEITEQHDLEKAIEVFMCQKEGRVVSEQAAKMKVAAAAAVAEGGSSFTALDKLVQLFSTPRRKD